MGGPIVLSIAGSIFSMWYLIVVGVIAVFFPGILFAIWFTFSYTALMVDDARGITALKASKAVVRNHIGKVVGNCLVIGLIVGVITLLLSLLFSIVGRVVSLTVPSLSIVAAVLKFCVGPVIGVWATAFYILLYRDLREVERSVVERVLLQGGFSENAAVPPSLS